MALPSSGKISFADINKVLCYGSPYNQQISLNDSAVRSLFGDTSGQISMADGYGKTTYTRIANATGGTITYSGSWQIHTFNSSENFRLTQRDQSSDIEFLLIGGGNPGIDVGGGGGYGGDGGQGGKVFYDPTSFKTGNLNINYNYAVGVAGAYSPSTINSLGYTTTYVNDNGVNGGLGGAGGYNSGGGGNGASGISVSNIGKFSGGGGGGGGGAFTPSSPINAGGGAGGDGTDGGGGGGQGGGVTWDNNFYGDDGQNGADGEANTGGGGGGGGCGAESDKSDGMGGYDGATTGGSGGWAGSGVVIIRFVYAIDTGC